MRKDGYVIAQNRKVAAFFTGSSSYDRPRWIAVTEATVYPTAELAQKAISKLLSYGAYEARIVPIKEAIEFSMPDEQQDKNAPNSTILPADGEAPPEDGQLPPPEEGDDQSMTAGDTEEVCDHCQHCPCTCDDEHNPDHEDDDVISDVDTELGNDPDNELSPEDVLGEPGMEDDLLQDEDQPHDELPSRLAPRMESLDTTVQQIKYKDQALQPNLNVPMDHDDKVKVPSDVMSDLSAAIAQYQKDADFTNTQDDARASFCMTVVDAFKALQAELQKGTVLGVKNAQIKMTSWMNPITSNLPVSVQRFVHMGGRKPTLKDLFDSKRLDKK